MRSPRVLLAQSLPWSNSARLAIAFQAEGFDVEVVAPRRHPIHRMRSPSRSYVYRSGLPRRSLKAAIEASRPDLIVPCDDPVVRHLHLLHSEDEGRASPIAQLIENSLGAPKSYDLLRSRRMLCVLAGLPDVCLARTDPIDSLKELRTWIERHGAPAMLKVDGSTGGQDLIPIYKPSRTAWAFLVMQVRRSRALQLKRALWNSALWSLDFGWIPDLIRKSPPPMSVQEFVSGRLANCAVACWRGSILASIAVEVVQSNRDFGIATVVRPVAGEGMLATARSICRHLELSGMHGFDFVIDSQRRAKLIEINPRATQINHLRLGANAGLIAPLRLALEGNPPVERPPVVNVGEIALFPQEWERDPKSPYLSSVFHDLPFEEPELIEWYGYKSPQGAGPKDDSQKSLSAWEPERSDTHVESHRAPIDWIESLASSDSSASERRSDAPAGDGSSATPAVARESRR